ncbi:nucleotidyltransferase [Halobacteriales archaeon SW_6_65_15]|jgi:predicted nucleotidyltransferase|nr:MAG: nucleotidyltransferase [Halobacteriales archaeon SW_6_65_15]
MKPVESASLGDSLPIADLQSVLREYPVRLAILFGSYASGNTHRSSDVDIAVEFESIDRESPAYNEMFFELGADLSDVLMTDDVDVVAVQTLSPGVAESILEDGVILVGDLAHAADLLQRIVAESSDERSPRERFDAAIGKIDEHLGDNSPVPATDGSRGGR